MHNLIRESLREYQAADTEQMYFMLTAEEKAAGTLIKTLDFSRTKYIMVLSNVSYIIFSVIYTYVFIRNTSLHLIEFFIDNGMEKLVCALTKEVLFRTIFVS